MNTPKALQNNITFPERWIDRECGQTLETDKHKASVVGSFQKQVYLDEKKAAH
jgi:hypothetical protein